MLAWVALLLSPAAQPFDMGESGGQPAAMAQSMGSHCDRMQVQRMAHAHQGSPIHHGGHPCCQHGGCYCVSPCSGIVGESRIGLARQDARFVLPGVTESRLVAERAAPPLRPPIA